MFIHKRYCDNINIWTKKKSNIVRMRFIFAAVLSASISCQQIAYAAPPSKPGNPGIPGLLADKDTQIVNLQEQIKVVNVAIDVLNAQILSLQAQLTAKDQQIADLNSQISEQNKQITGLNADIAAADSQIAALNTKKKKLENMALVSQTGQTQCWDTTGALIDCLGTGQDGNLRAGVAWPNPRFIDNGDGTVKDNLTKLVWLKNAGCEALGPKGTWQQALVSAHNLQNGVCDLNDGSQPGSWRVPNINELASIIDYGQSLPSFPSGTPFYNLQHNYWSSTTVKRR
jgi:hypothetical protein